MHTWSSRRTLYLVIALAALAVVAIGVLFSNRAPKADVVPSTAAAPARASVITVGNKSQGRAIPSGFLGLSLEYTSIGPYAGTDPSAVDPVFEQLVRNLTPGQAPVIRIGGDTTDWTWYPIAHMHRPAGVRNSLDPAWLGVMSSLSKALDARLILGINLEANNRRLSAAEGRAFVNGIGRARIAALEIGNEPELYGSLAWYVLHGQRFYGRPHSYSYTDYLKDFARIRAVLPRVPLAGPAVGGKQWILDTPQFVAAEPRLATVTLHRYPLLQCFIGPSSSMYPSIAHILAPRATTGLADSVAPYARLAHRHGLPLRIDEMNSLSCGQDHHVADAFVSSLWAVDALFEMARVGVDGVNIYSNPGAAPQLFTFRQDHGHWTASVKPDYYGLMMFAQAAPPGSHLLQLSGAGGPIKAWATRARDGQIHVVLINRGRAGSRTLAVRVPGTAPTAMLERLQAVSLTAHSGVTLGGQSFGSATTTGQLAGISRIKSVARRGGSYRVKLPAGSAAMLTLPAH